MRKVLFVALVMTGIMAMAYYGCGSDGGGGGSDGGAKTDGGGTTDGGTTTDGGGGKTCTVDPNSIVGQPCTEDNKDTVCAGITSPACLTESFCAGLICGPGEDCSKCNIPNGYCSSLEFMLDPPGNCGKGALWFNVSEIDPTIKAALCVKCCKTDNDCRIGENYWCYIDSKGRGGCVPPGFHKILDKDGGA